jgi:hypothetical protein
MGFFSKIWKSIKKPFKAIGKAIKGAFKSFGKLMNKAGILGQVAMFFILPGIANAALGALGGAFTGAAASLAGSTATGIMGSIARGAGWVMQKAGQFASVAQAGFKTVTGAVTEFFGATGRYIGGKLGIGKLPNISAKQAWGQYSEAMVKNFDAFKTAGAEFFGRGATAATAPLLPKGGRIYTEDFELGDTSIRTPTSPIESFRPEDFETFSGPSAATNATRNLPVLGGTGSGMSNLPVLGNAGSLSSNMSFDVGIPEFGGGLSGGLSTPTVSKLIPPVATPPSLLGRVAALPGQALDYAKALPGRATNYVVSGDMGRDALAQAEAIPGSIATSMVTNKLMEAVNPAEEYVEKLPWYSNTDTYRSSPVVQASQVAADDYLAFMNQYSRNTSPDGLWGGAVNTKNYYDNYMQQFAAA